VERAGLAERASFAVRFTLRHAGRRFLSHRFSMLLSLSGFQTELREERRFRMEPVEPPIGGIRVRIGDRVKNHAGEEVLGTEMTSLEPLDTARRAFVRRRQATVCRSAGRANTTIAIAGGSCDCGRRARRSCSSAAKRDDFPVNRD